MENYTFWISGLLAFTMSCLELIYGKYKLKHQLVLKKPRYMLWYASVYGILAILITYLISNSDLIINEFKPSENPIKIAIGIGLTIKSLSKISFYNFTIGEKTISIGPKLVFDYLDDFLLKRLNDDIDNQLLIIIKRVSIKLKSNNRTLRIQDQLIDEVTPTNYTLIMRSSLMKEINGLKKPFDKCRYFTDKFGFDRLKMLERNLDSE
jgi:hypothetical protein